jgi:hypothetical protein
MVTTVTDVLNIWNDMGVFSYVIPFLLIFAVVFAILKKTGILGDDKGILSIISAALGLLSLQFDIVPDFFSVVFPRFGVGLSLFLVVLIIFGLFAKKGDDNDFRKRVGWIAWPVGLGIIIWSLSAWDEWNISGGFGGWFADNIWAILVLGGIIAVIAVVATRD